MRITLAIALSLIAASPALSAGADCIEEGKIAQRIAENRNAGVTLKEMQAKLASENEPASWAVPMSKLIFEEVDIHDPKKIRRLTIAGCEDRKKK